MDFEMWDLNSLSNEDLQSLSDFAKTSGLPHHEVFLQWSEKNPGKLKKVGEFRNNDFISNEITPDGVKEIRGADVINNILKEKNKDDKND